LVKQAEIRSRRVAIGASSARTLQQPPATTPESLCLSGPAARINPNRFGETLLLLHVLLVLSGVLAMAFNEHNMHLTVASWVGMVALRSADAARQLDRCTLSAAVESSATTRVLTLSEPCAESHGDVPLTVYAVAASQKP
jgi:hypothetical protein